MRRKVNKKSIITKKGDKGYTRLLSGERVSKSSPRLDVCGDIDELNSILSAARYHVTKEGLRDDILNIQKALFTVGAELVATSKKAKCLKGRVDKKALQELEDKCKVLEAKTKTPANFVIFGSSLAAAHLDHARTVARRCERKIVSLVQKKLVTNKILIAWLNRLSDYLYLMSRLEEENPTIT